MKVLTGVYNKKDGSKRNVNLLVLENNQNHVSGIDIELLSQEEKAELKKLNDDYWNNIKKFMGVSYRQFIKEGFESSQYEEI